VSGTVRYRTDATAKQYLVRQEAIAMTDLITILEALNRKERFFLVGEALGNCDFRLGSDYRKRLQGVTGMDIPSDAWVAMDYHLDWISAAVHMVAKGRDFGDIWSNPEESPIVHGTQEDVDLIIGFRDGSKTVLILVEAKGDTSWSNKQMKSKAERLGLIFGNGNGESEGIVTSFVLTSPSEPTERLVTDDWPDWMVKDDRRPRWMSMDMTGRRQLIRCDENMNKKVAAGYAVVK
jgi:hypothetical protein